MFFWNSLPFSMIQWILAIWCVVPLHFLNLNIWKFMVHVLLKTDLETSENYFTSVWDDCNCVVVWAFFALPFLGLEWKLTFSSPMANAEFSKFAVILKCSTFTASSFKIWEKQKGRGTVKRKFSCREAY